jgi:hypothetical protein
MMNKIVISIPRYVTRVMVSEKRRKRYYLKDDKLPEYLNDSERYIWKSDKGLTKLFDTVTKNFMVKNSKSFGTPRYESIAGNTSYSGWHERTRMKIMESIKSDYRRVLKDMEPIRFSPLKISLNLFTVPGAGDWDLDNLWIYYKAFGDVLQELGIIKNDNVRNITSTGGIEYTPVDNHDDRKLEFVIEHDNREVLKDHVMFNPEIQKPQTVSYFEEKHLYVVEDSSVELGKISMRPMSTGDHMIMVCTGKRSVAFGPLNRILKKIYSLAVQYNLPVVFSEQFLKRCTGYARENLDLRIKEYLSRKGIKVYYIEFKE